MTKAHGHFTVGRHGAVRMLKDIGVDDFYKLDRAIANKWVPVTLVEGRQRFDAARLRDIIDREREAERRRAFLAGRKR